jgi:hypothetical protein
MTLRRFHYVCLATLFTTATGRAADPLLAFPEAQGAGRFTVGGRGGEVYRVTTLNAEGPGSLADAVSQPHRIVVFAVSGIIDLSRRKGGGIRSGALTIDQPHITIAGQSAPGEGICIKGGEVKVTASDVIIRYLRSRRGFVTEGDSGDAFDIKPESSGEAQGPGGESPEAFDKKAAKKAERGKIVQAPGRAADILLDHLSASWATDKNLTLTHADRSTAQYCIAAEGLDYGNPKQTPPNHSEGSLWGSSLPGGASTMDHMLYAHNRLRNPRTTGGSAVPAELTFSNSVVYDWSEFASHTGSEIVRLYWLNNYYKPGPSTPADAARHFFSFEGDVGSRLYLAGNFLEGFPDATANNALAVAYGEKLKRLTAAQKSDMILPAAPGKGPAGLQTAQEAFEAVLQDCGATLPARDAVDLRIIRSVREGTGRIIEKETDLAPEERWPDYRSLPAPRDSDADGLPDFWEEQFGLDPRDAGDSAKLAEDGHANIEHYLNNTDPAGGRLPAVYIAASVSRASQRQAGEWKVYRKGDLSGELTVKFTVSGDAHVGADFLPLPSAVTLRAGQRVATIQLQCAATSTDNRSVVVSLQPERDYHIGCPAQSLAVIRGRRTAP